MSSHTTTTTTSSQAPPPPSLLVYSCILNPSNCKRTHAHTLSIPHIRHLLFHQQVVGLEKGRSHQGAGSCEGYWFMHRPDLLFPSIPTPFLLSAFPVFARGLLYFDIGMWRNKWNKEWNLCGWDKEMPKGMWNHLTLKERMKSKWQSLWWAENRNQDGKLVFWFSWLNSWYCT